MKYISYFDKINFFILLLPLASFASATDFKLINADSNLQVLSIQEGQSISRDELPESYTISYEPASDRPQQVTLQLKGPVTAQKREASYPYTLFGDILTTGNYNGNPSGKALVEGDYSISANGETVRFSVSTSQDDDTPSKPIEEETVEVVPNQKPFGNFSQPLPNAQMIEGSDLSVTVNASDVDGKIQNVRLYLDGAFIRQENAAPFTWPNANLGDGALRDMDKGSYELMAEITDNLGLSTRIQTNVTVIEKAPAEEAVTQIYKKNDGPMKNPHKGWNSAWWNDHQESSVGFQYLAWKDLEPTNGKYNFQAVEDLLERPGTEGRHFVLRLYCDWHGSELDSAGCPDWIYNEVGVARLRGDNGRYITDFNDPRYVSEAVKAIKALADQYDNDPRVHVFQVGVMGYWGEWHTSGSSFGGAGYELDQDALLTIYNAYKSNFSNAKIQGRYPWRAPLASVSGIGFHNDYFVANNGHSDSFDESISDDAGWLEGPIGGETPPRDNDEAADERVALFETSKGQSMLEAGHYTTMKPGAYHREKGELNYQGYMKFHKKMGYNFQIQSASFLENVSEGSDLEVYLDIDNIGVAPMYYDWDIQFALLDGNNDPIALSEVNFDLTTILPDEQAQFAATFSKPGQALGSYRLAVRIIQPGADTAKSSAWQLDARNTYILFSNDVAVIDGVWGSGNKLEGGWSILGNINFN